MRERETESEIEIMRERERERERERGYDDYLYVDDVNAFSLTSVHGR